MEKRLFFFVFLLMALYSCNKDDTTVSLTLSDTSTTLLEGDSVTLTVTYLSASLAASDCVWSSSATNVATVDATGKIKALKAGSATITAALSSDKSITGTCELTVYHNGASASTPYLIYTLSDFKAMRDSINTINSKYGGLVYKLMADLDFSGDSSWVPIGNKDYNPFSGTFDGNGKTIKNIRIGKTASSVSIPYAGIFGNTKNAVISNLGVNWTVINTTGNAGGLIGMASDVTLTNCYATGDITGGECAGGLIGSGGGVISNCYATGNVTSTNYAGGLIGAKAAGTIRFCHSTGNVSGGRYVGGFLGSGSGKVVNCYSTGSVTGTGYTGGFLGYIDISSVAIVNCYATGSVSGGEYAGGLLGAGYFNGTIINCYAAGSVSGSDYAGGIAGYYDFGLINNCLALNGSVVCTGSNAARIANFDTSPSVSNNFASTSMTVTNNSGTIASFTDTRNHGSNMSALAVDLLNAYVTANASYSSITLNNWKITSGVNNGYPVFK
jgi:hypothetical protein